MRLLGKGEEGELTVLEVAFLSYSGSEPMAYRCGHTTEKATGLYVQDTSGSSWLVPGLLRPTCDIVAETLFREGKVSLTDFVACYIYPEE